MPGEKKYIKEVKINKIYGGTIDDKKILKDKDGKIKDGKIKAVPQIGKIKRKGDDDTFSSLDIALENIKT